MKTARAMVTVALTAVAFAGAQTGHTSTERNKIEGTWEHVFPDPESTQKPPEGIKHIKLIAGQHFVWVWYDSVKGNPQYTGGGTYTLTGDSYTEHINFINVKDADKFVDKDQPFTIKLEGDTLTISGKLPNGQKISETWKRVD
jgi:hypothetical protein